MGHQLSLRFIDNFTEWNGKARAWCFHASCGDFKNNYSKDIAVLNEIVLCIMLTRVTNFVFQKNNYEHAEKIIIVHTL